MLCPSTALNHELAYVRVIDARLSGNVALTRHTRTAHAAKSFVPRSIGMVFADPPYAETNGTVLIHLTNYPGYAMVRIYPRPVILVQPVDKTLPLS